MGFVSKYQRRDSELPGHRESLREAIEEDLFTDHQVIGVFYGGSIGNEDTDNYSDIDVRIVVSPEKLQRFIVEKKERPNKWGNILFFEDVGPKVPYTVAHFDCFVKVDIFYFKPEDIHPSVWFKNIKIVKDKEHLLNNVKNKSMALTYAPTIEDIEFWRTKFFAHFHESYRRIMRNEMCYTLKSVDHLRHAIVSAWYMEKGIPPNSVGDWANYEGARSQLNDWQLSLLAEWDCGHDRMEIMNVRKSITAEFKRMHKILCDKVGMKEQADVVEKIINMAL